MIFKDYHVFGEVDCFKLIDQYAYENPNPAHHDQILRFNDFVEMQYTGLKDKNGKEIYEGDLLEDISKELVATAQTRYFQGEYWNTDGSELEFVKKGHIYLIEEDESNFFRRRYINWFRTNSGQEDGKPVTGLLNGCDESVIIGNIYENPELIKEKI
jgi:uncharacterized phage protein (TIGR01671 family)